MCEIGLCGSEWGPNVGSCEKYNETSDYILGGEFIDQLRGVSASKHDHYSMLLVIFINNFLESDIRGTVCFVGFQGLKL